MTSESPPVVPTSASPSILKSAAAMSLATLSSRILGMVRDMVMAALFTPLITDAYVVAFRLPNLFRRILGEGSLAASFVPLYVDARHKNEAEARGFAQSVFSMLAILTATLSVLGTIYMPWVMGHLVGGEGYMQVEGKFELTVFLARIMFSYLFLVMTYAFYMSIANAHKVFFWPAFAPAIFNLVTIVMAFTPAWHVVGDQLAWGVVVGGVLQLALSAGPLLKLGVLPRFTWNWAGPRVARFFKVLLPSLLGMSIAQLLGVLNVNFASRLEQGTHSYIYFADRLLEFPQSLLSVSLGVALLPTLSDLWARAEKAKFLETVERHARLLLTLSLPAAVGLYVMAEPMITVIFKRGEFGDHDVAATAQVLSIYAIVLVVSGLHRVVVPAFYAVHNTWLPAANSAFCLLAHYFIADWATTTHGLPGLVGATAFTGALNFAILLISYRLIFGKIQVLPFVRSTAWLLPSLVAMGLVAHFSYAELFLLAGPLIALGISIGAAVVVFFGVNALVKHPEATEILALLKRRARR